MTEALAIDDPKRGTGNIGLESIGLLSELIRLLAEKSAVGDVAACWRNIVEGQPLTPPAVRPCSMYFSNQTKRMITGTVTITLAAMTWFQGVWS